MGCLCTESAGLLICEEQALEPEQRASGGASCCAWLCRTRNTQVHHIAYTASSIPKYAQIALEACQHELGSEHFWQCRRLAVAAGCSHCCCCGLQDTAMAAARWRRHSHAQGPPGGRPGRCQLQRGLLCAHQRGQRLHCAACGAILHLPTEAKVCLLCTLLPAVNHEH